MAEFDASPLDDHFKVVVQQGKKVYSTQIVAAVDRIWEKALENHPYLFNGKIFSYESFSQQTLYGQFIDYKYFYASFIDSEVRAELQLVPVGVTGITKCEEKTLIGKRSENVTLFRGQYEFVPAGSLDPLALVDGEVNLSMQYREELEEEAGIPGDYIDAITPFLLVCDKGDGLMEIFAHIELSDGALQLSGSESSEYSELLWLDDESLRDHFEKHRSQYVGVSGYCLANHV